MASKMWYKLVLCKQRSSKSKKRSYMTANVIEKSVSETLENLKKSLTSETSDMINSFNSFRRKSIDNLETKKDCRSLTSDLNLLLAIQGIIKIDSQTPAEFKSFGREKKSELYSIASRMPSQVKNEIEDALEEYRLNNDKKKLEKKLMLISMDASGALERVVKVLLSLLSHMTVAKKDNSEMRLQSGAVASFGNLFKLSDNHDPHGYNKILFNTEALSNCRPDYVVSVGASDEDEVINIGQEFTFFLCSLSSGICTMIEISTIVALSTLLEFTNFSSQLHALYNIACLYESQCIVAEVNQHEWPLLSFEAIKQIYDMETTKATTANTTQNKNSDAQN
ncbi:hypothetical protein EDC96DRAFT_543468 [Choanephora cucurbitarum]|nr:hypothetical protein EDC96DRAFT_543468 [Choanephora cucurbitarum]